MSARAKKPAAPAAPAPAPAEPEAPDGPRPFEPPPAAPASAGPSTEPSGPLETPPGPAPGASLWERVAWVMRQLDRIPQAGENPHHHYKYATADDIAQVVRPLFAEAGLAVSMTVLGMKARTRPTRTGSTDIVTLRVRFTLHSPDGEKASSVLLCEGEDPGDKGVWKAYTGGLKYFLRTHLLLSTGGEDPEAGGTQGIGEDPPRQHRQPQQRHQTRRRDRRRDEAPRPAPAEPESPSEPKAPAPPLTEIEATELLARYVKLTGPVAKPLDDRTRGFITMAGSLLNDPGASNEQLHRALAFLRRISQRLPESEPSYEEMEDARGIVVRQRQDALAEQPDPTPAAEGEEEPARTPGEDDETDSAEG